MRQKKTPLPIRNEEFRRNFDAPLWDRDIVAIDRERTVRTYGYELEKRRVAAGAGTPVRTDITRGRSGRVVGVRLARNIREQGKGASTNGTAAVSEP